MLLPVSSLAYVGPGAGLTAIGTVLAILAAFVLAIVGFVWYPMKRLLRARKAKKAEAGETRVEDGVDTANDLSAGKDSQTADKSET
jgi:hypothetical protein